MTITLIDEARYDAEMDATVLPALQACMTEGWMEPATVDWEGKALPKLERPGRLHYYRYDARTFDALREEGASGVFRGTVVISHGFTEFGRKYSEMVWYFLLAGYSVCVFEHRGHGHSAHDMSNPSLVWIDDWRRYVADFATFAQTVGREAADGGPMYLYCHSMGGGIGAAALEQYPSLFDRAVLSCPMIAPQTGMPMWLTRVLVDVLCACGMGRHRVFGQKDFDGVLDLGPYQLSSEPRERWYHKLRCENREYQTYCASFEWVHQAMRLNSAILRPSACAEIETPILLFQAGHDIWVRNQPQNVFVRRVIDGGGQARLVHIADSEHEVFSMPNAVFGPYLKQVLKFYNAPMIAGSEE